MVMHRLAVESSMNDEALKNELHRKILDRSARAGVIGLGCVGLPLAVEIAKHGFQITGIDLDNCRVEAVNAGLSYVPDVSSETLLPLVRDGRLRATQTLTAIEELDTINICVPTLLDKTKGLDLSYVVTAIEAIRTHLHPGILIILESTVYPGTTRELTLPILERSGLQVGRDFFLAFSPERVDPENRGYTTRNIPKVVAGITPQCLELAVLFCQQCVEQVIPVSSIDTAEMVKLLENTFRSVNIALVNEMASICHKLKINIWEVIETARTKPFGYMPFYPGPGLGAPCIFINPYYLTWRAKIHEAEPRLIEVAASINSRMPAFIVNRLADVLNDRGKSLRNAKILGVGITYTCDITEVHESLALEVLQALASKGAVVHYTDPYVPSITTEKQVFHSFEPTPDLLGSMDCVVVLVDHSVFDYALIANFSPLILDCRNALKDYKGPHILRL
jgi:UDP-N-acetyl-D-glucosamine dehydrogenase